MLQYYSCNISLLSASSAQNSQFKDCSLGRSLSPPSQVWLSYIFGDHVTSRQNETFRGHQCGRDTQIAAGDCEFRRNVRVIWQLTVVITSCWWRGAASSVAGGHDTVVLRHLGVTGRLVSGYSLPPPAAPTLSHIMDQMTACVRKVSSCKLQKTIAFVNQSLAVKNCFLQVYLQPWIFALSSSAPLHIRWPPHPLTYTNIDIETGILTPISTDTDQQKS